MKKKHQSEFIIADLIVKKLEGKLTDKEAKYLADWQYEKESNLLLYHRLLKNPERNYFERENRLEGGKKSENWKTVQAVIAQKKRKRFLMQTGKVAVAVTILFSIGYYLNTLKAGAYFDNDIISQAETKAVVLITEKGNEYQLNEELDWKTDEIQIHNDSKEINYKKIKEQKRKQLSYHTLVVPKGEKYKVTLVDGSVVHLNSKSSLKYPSNFGEKSRRVELQGEAMFKIVKDSLRPFIVHMDKTEIEVLGTSFNVSAYKTDDEIITTLVEGKVTIKNEFYEVKETLLPNDQVMLSKTKGVMTKKVVDTDLYTAWIHNRFVFENETLENIMKRLEREYDVEVFFQNKQVRELHFTGELKRYENIDPILDMLATTKRVKFTKKKGSLLVE